MSITVPRLAKEQRMSYFSHIIQRDDEPILLNGKEYKGRFTQPSMKKTMNFAGYKNEVLNYDLLIVVENNDKTPEGNQIVERRNDGQKYRILEVQNDFGSNCYTLSLTEKN